MISTDAAAVMLVTMELDTSSMREAVRSVSVANSISTSSTGGILSSSGSLGVSVHPAIWMAPHRMTINIRNPGAPLLEAGDLYMIISL
jgi:hypothetical protein